MHTFDFLKIIFNKNFIKIGLSVIRICLQIYCIFLFCFLFFSFSPVSNKGLVDHAFRFFFFIFDPSRLT